MQAVTELKDLVKEHIAQFVMYRKGELHYRTSSGFDFVVPIEDCGDGVFLAQDKAILFMCYIRKQLEANEAGRASTASLSSAAATDSGPATATSSRLSGS